MRNGYPALADETASARTVRIAIPGYRSSYVVTDFSDLHVRSVEKEIAQFLVDHVAGAGRSLAHLVLQIDNRTPDRKRETVTVQAYRELFADLANVHTRRSLRQLPRAVSLACVGMLMLFASHEVGASPMEEPIRHTLSGAVLVGGWVSMWTAFAALFFEATGALRQSLVFRRLASIPITVEYTEPKAPLDSYPAFDASGSRRRTGKREPTATLPILPRRTATG